MVVANDDVLAEKARLLRTHGSKPKYYHKLVGANFRLDAMQAAFLRVKLPHYNSFTEKRKANAAFYTEKLSKLPGVALASDLQNSAETNAKMILPVAQPNCEHIWNQYTLRLPGAGRRDALKKHLTDRGIGTEIYYPVPMHEQECFAYCTTSNAKNSCPTASRLAQEVISIPIYPELAPAQREEVVAELAAFLK
jgi:dTDP-4-amino-4,6-dideoxygalactose transaminase